MAEVMRLEFFLEGQWDADTANGEICDLNHPFQFRLLGALAPLLLLCICPSLTHSPSPIRMISVPIVHLCFSKWPGPQKLFMKYLRNEGMNK